MSQRRALVVHTRMPAFDRDSGSQDIDNTLQFLLRAGWQVTFLAREEKGVAEERHAQRLRQMGIATHTGFGAAERLLRSGGFDLALIAFWEPAARAAPADPQAVARHAHRRQLDGRPLPARSRGSAFGHASGARRRLRERGDAASSTSTTRPTR